jgi:hypothetical protein
MNPDRQQSDLRTDVEGAILGNWNWRKEVDILRFQYKSE